MKERNLLTDKWLFVGAQKFDGVQWQPSESYVKGMCWEFTPRYLINDKIIGLIVETTPTANSEEMAYAYNSETQKLEAEIQTEAGLSTFYNPQADIYQVEIITPNYITLSILNEVGYPSNFFRYELSRI